jgi:hypothetical protein
MTFDFTVQGTAFRVIIPSGFPRVAAATTIGHTVRFQGGGVPNDASLAHEYFHVLHTSWVRYLLSVTIGKLWGDGYADGQERAANAYQNDPANVALFAAAAAMLRAALPATWPTVRIEHGT